MFDIVYIPNPLSISSLREWGFFRFLQLGQASYSHFLWCLHSDLLPIFHSIWLVAVVGWVYDCSRVLCLKQQQTKNPHHPPPLLHVDSFKGCATCGIVFSAIGMHCTFAYIFIVLEKHTNLCVSVDKSLDFYSMIIVHSVIIQYINHLFCVCVCWHQHYFEHGIHKLMAFSLRHWTYFLCCHIDKFNHHPWNAMSGDHHYHHQKAFFCCWPNFLNASKQLNKLSSTIGNWCVFSHAYLERSSLENLRVSDIHHMRHTT